MPQDVGYGNKPKKRGRQKRMGATKSKGQLGRSSFQTKNPEAFRDRKKQQAEIKKLLAG